mgnify:CR=1 FL=1
MKQNKNKFPTLELLNYEGAVLTAVKTTNVFVILDEYKKVVDALTLNEFKEFLYKDREIIDSKGRSWTYKMQHYIAKQSPETVINFLQTDWNGISKPACKQ